MNAVRALRAEQIFTGEAMRGPTVLLVENGRVRDLCAEPPPGVPLERLPAGLILAPGFIDLQVNGGGGVLFNDCPSVETLRIMAAAHRRFGTTAMMPTLITDIPAKMGAAAAAVRAAQDSNEPGIIGLHFEGPFLNPLRKGVHDPALIRPPTQDDLRFLCEQTPRPLLLTLAPEIAGEATIALLTRAGIAVSIGHSAASYEQARAAVTAGARGFTHLFNAMPPLSGRDPGLLGAALESPAGVAGIIADGHHVHPANLRLAWRTRQAGGLALVTDAMASVGTDLDGFVLQGRRVRVDAGRLLAEDGVLAGAHLEMAAAVRNAMRLMGASLQDALRMASTTPAALLGLIDRGHLLPGAVADMVAITDDSAIHRVWIAGEA